MGQEEKFPAAACALECVELEIVTGLSVFVPESLWPDEKPGHGREHPEHDRAPYSVELVFGGGWCQLTDFESEEWDVKVLMTPLLEE